MTAAEKRRMALSLLNNESLDSEDGDDSSWIIDNFVQADIF